jgi:hypothetical protein
MLPPTAGSKKRNASDGRRGDHPFSQKLDAARAEEGRELARTAERRRERKEEGGRGRKQEGKGDRDGDK